jgi:uncharacterized protein (TIGR03067 family)
VRTLVLLVVSAGVMSAAPVPKGLKKAAPPLDGRWRIVEAVYDGQPQDVSRAEDWYIEGEWFKLGSPPVTDGRTGLKLIRDEKNPAQVEYHNIHGDGSVSRFPGLLEVSGDEMKFCYVSHGNPRPTEMAPAKGVTYRVFKRVEEK